LVRGTGRANYVAILSRDNELSRGVAK